jgi:hypothetical protein
MKSRITIEVDFENANTPVIKIAHQKSDDVRDSLIGNFLQHLDHGSISRWMKIEYKGETDSGHIWSIVPIKSDLALLEQESKLMSAVVTTLNNQLAEANNR